MQNCCAQNFVPNSSFEDYSACPWGVSTPTEDQVAYATGWSMFCQTPDYLHECATNILVSVPYNGFGYQEPLSGDGYCGFYTYASSNYREIIGVKLLDTMEIGQTYFIKFYVCSGRGGYFGPVAGTDKIGMKFSTVSYSFNNPISINNQAHFYTENIITDTINWVELSGTFVADSAYQYVAIGNFFDDAHTDTIHYAYTGLVGYPAYYFVDDVCISLDKDANCDINLTSGSEPSTVLLNIFPNPADQNLTVQHGKREVQNWFILNSLLKPVKSGTANGRSDLEIETSSLPQGIYFLRLTGKDWESVKEVFIVH
jgi:hypothetical protein